MSDFLNSNFIWKDFLQNASLTWSTFYDWLKGSDRTDRLRLGRTRNKFKLGDLGHRHYVCKLRLFTVISIYCDGAALVAKETAVNRSFVYDQSIIDKKLLIFASSNPCFGGIQPLLVELR